MEFNPKELVQSYDHHFKNSFDHELSAKVKKNSHKKNKVSIHSMDSSNSSVFKEPDHIGSKRGSVVS